MHTAATVARHNGFVTATSDAASPSPIKQREESRNVM
jgi:hypothetical protein